MIYEHPLAYILGVEGVALLRSFQGEHDREFVEARIAEIRKLVDDPSLEAGVDVSRVDSVEGYGVWSATYDHPRNSIFDFEEPFVREILDSLPLGTAVDAACGTGRYAEYLASLGHDVIGVDSSPDMLARARDRVPAGSFRAGDLHDLPLDDDHADVVVCSLALTHVPDPAPVMAEFARVLRPGGHLVISDIHHLRVLFGSVPCVRASGDRPARLTAYRHLAGDYLRAALPVGLQVRRCEEPPMPIRQVHAETTDPGDNTGGGGGRTVTLDPWDTWPWSLTDLIPEAASAANAGIPATIIWDFQLSPLSPR